MAHDGGERGAGSLLSRMQHGLFVLLTGIGLARALTTGAALAPVLLGVTLLLGWYAAGLALARRTHTNLAIWWLLGLTAVWLGLVLVSSEFVWVAVSLWLLAGHFLRVPWAIAYTIAVLVIGGRPWAPSSPSPSRWASTASCAMASNDSVSSTRSWRPKPNRRLCMPNWLLPSVNPVLWPSAPDSAATSTTGSPNPSRRSC